MNWYLKVLKEYVNFKGRARRKEYWMFILVNFIISLILTVVDNLLIHSLGFPTLGAYGILTMIYMLGVLLPNLGVLVRRLHDVGKSGYWFFIAFIPLVGAIILLIFLCTPSQKGENKWGPSPLEEGLPQLDVNEFDNL